METMGRLFGMSFILINYLVDYLILHYPFDYKFHLFSELKHITIQHRVLGESMYYSSIFFEDPSAWNNFLSSNTFFHLHVCKTVSEKGLFRNAFHKELGDREQQVCIELIVIMSNFHMRKEMKRLWTNISKWKVQNWISTPCGLGATFTTPAKLGSIFSDHFSSNRCGLNNIVS